jgi:hypothetical protein
MKSELLSKLKELGYRKNSRSGEAFKIIDGLRLYIKIEKDDVLFDELRYYVSFGVSVEFPFVSKGSRYSIVILSHTIKYDELCYGGELQDMWPENAVSSLWKQIERVCLPWIEEMSKINPLIEHLEWRMENGLYYIEPEQQKMANEERGIAGKELAGMFGKGGDRINFKDCEKFNLQLALIEDSRGNSVSAKRYIYKYLEYLGESVPRKKEILEIQEKINSGLWPTCT